MSANEEPPTDVEEPSDEALQFVERMAQAGAGMSGGQRGPGREDMVASYLPSEGEWSAKTILELSDPGAVAALSQFDSLFPEVAELQDVIDEFLLEFMRSRISVGGQSRQEFRDIFAAMYGKHTGDSGGSQLAAALAADLYEDD